MSQMPRGLHRDGIAGSLGAPPDCARCRRMVLLSVVRKARHPDLYALSRWRASPSVFSPMSPGWGHDLLLVFKPEYLADLLKLVGPDHVADRDRHIPGHPCGVARYHRRGCQLHTGRVAAVVRKQHELDLPLTLQVPAP